MKISVVPIGNSKGIRIPKAILDDLGIENEVEMKISRGGLRLIPIHPDKNTLGASAMLSEKVLGHDWNRPEEDQAWKTLQKPT